MLLTGGAGFAMAQENSFRASATNEAVCGFIVGPAFYSEAAKVKQGLAVDLFVGDARTDQPLKLRFYINQRPGGQPVDNVQIEHEKFMHLIGVREDLSEFFHIHPLKVAPGMWVARTSLPMAGITSSGRTSNGAEPRIRLASRC